MFRTLLLLVILACLASCKKDRLPCEENNSGILCIENGTTNDIDVTLNRINVNVTQAGQSFNLGIIQPGETKCESVFIGDLVVNGFNNQLESWGDEVTIEECETLEHTLN